MRAPAPSDFPSRLRSPAVAARIGVWLGGCFAVCFVTGLLSHYAQQPHQPVPFPTSPSWGYRVTQGVHVAAGTAAVPLLLVKLWTVYPRLFAPLGEGGAGQLARRLRRLVLTMLERASIAVLVAAAVFELASGLANASKWYPWHFSFPPVHYAIGWVAVGALLLHVAVKLPLIREVLGADVEAPPHDREGAVRPGALTRRGLLGATGLAAVTATLLTAGAGVPGLRRVSVLAVRSGDGPQGVPINKSATAAGVLTTARDPRWRLEVVHGDRTVLLSRDDLLALPQHTESLPIACVEGWSVGAVWRGARIRDVLAQVGAPSGHDVAVASLQPHGVYARSTLPANFWQDERTLLALELHGEPLDIDHGYPCRLIAPDRPGVLQTKWLTRLEVLS